MIHIFAFMDIEIGLGRTIYSDDTIQISEELIWPMITALNNFILECTNDESGLRNALLKDIKIYVYSPISADNPLKFVFFTDLYDNIDYLELKGQHIYQLLAEYLDIQYFNPPEDTLEKAIAIAKFTQRFNPDDVLDPQVEEYISQKLKELEASNKVIFASLGIGDIDGGVVHSFVERYELQEKTSDELFGQLLTTFEIDDSLISYSNINKTEKMRIKEYSTDPEELLESWYLKQVGGSKSDFWLFSYMFIKKDENSQVLEFLDWLAKELESRLKNIVIERPF